MIPVTAFDSLDKTDLVPTSATATRPGPLQAPETGCGRRCGGKEGTAVKETFTMLNSLKSAGKD